MTATLWLLVVLGTAAHKPPVVIERFADEASCLEVRQAVIAGAAGESPGYTRCIKARNVVTRER